MIEVLNWFAADDGTRFVCLLLLIGTIGYAMRRK